MPNDFDSLFCDGGQGNGFAGPLNGDGYGDGILGVNGRHMAGDDDTGNGRFVGRDNGSGIVSGPWFDVAEKCDVILMGRLT